MSQKKLNLHEQVYHSIKSSIIAGELAPGEKLRETKLSELLHTSRTPIREALRKLEQEGLVKYLADQGAEVTGLSKKTIIDLYECRSQLEGLAARLAAEGIQQAELNMLEETIILSKQYYDRGDYDKVIEKNTIFHDTIVAVSKNQPLMQMMDQLQSQILRYRRINSDVGFRPTFIEEHTDIFTAIQARDGQRAKLLMEQHILKDLVSIVAGLEKAKIL